MVLAITTTCAAILLAVVLVKRERDRRKMEQHTITPEALRALLTSNQSVVVIDVRQPLDMLGDSVIIPGAQWFAPEGFAQTLRCFRKSRTWSFTARARVTKLVASSCVELSPRVSRGSNS